MEPRYIQKVGTVGFEVSEIDTATGEHVDREYVLSVRFSVAEWREHGPFGGSEMRREVVDESYQYRLNCEDTTLDRLYDLFSAEWVEKQLRAAEDRAKEITTTRPEESYELCA